jgi:transposase
LESQVAQLESQVARLEKQVAELLERLHRNSGNSSSPPSTDSPADRADRHGRGKGASGKKQGGQPGHKGSSRAPAPPELVDHVIHQYPTHCENCHAALPETQHPDPRRFQASELPEIKPTITEFQQHGVECPCCHEVTWPAHDTLPLSPFGPRLSAVVALMTGVYHLSRRSTETLLHDLLGVKVSLGALSAIEARVSEAVKPAVQEAWAKVESGEVKHADGTSWYKMATLCALWTVATTAATVFKIVTDGTRETLQKLFGGGGGILVSDRATALKFWAMEKRQVCWAHLLRKFIAFSEQGGAVGSTGKELLDYVSIMFAYWDDLRSQRITREQFRAHMAPLRQQVEAALQRAAASGLARTPPSTGSRCGRSWTWLAWTPPTTTPNASCAHSSCGAGALSAPRATAATCLPSG